MYRRKRAPTRTVGKNRWVCCKPTVLSDQMETVDYRLTAQGRIAQVMICPQGHRKEQIVAAEPLADDCPMETRRAYIMGATVGFVLGNQIAGQVLAKTVRELRRNFSVSQIRWLLGYSESHIRRMLRGEHPAPMGKARKLSVDRITRARVATPAGPGR